MSERTRVESEVDVLKAMAFSRRLIEQAATTLAGCAQELNLRQGPIGNGVKLIQRGWDKIDDYLGREISDEAMASFLSFIEQLRKEEERVRAEEKGAGDDGGDSVGADGEDQGADGSPPAGVGGAGDDEEASGGAGQAPADDSEER